MLYPATKQEVARFGPTVRRLKPWGPQVSAACKRTTGHGVVAHHDDCAVKACACLCHIYRVHA